MKCLDLKIDDLYAKLKFAVEQTALIELHSKEVELSVLRAIEWYIITSNCVDNMRVNFKFEDDLLAYPLGQESEIVKKMSGMNECT